MPQKHCHYDFDFCPRCGCTEGSPFLRRWAREERPKQKKIFDEQHNLIAIETIEEEEWDINRVRSKMGLPPLGKNGLIELENTNREVRTYMIAIAQRWDALGITFPLFIRKYPELLKEFDIQRITNVYYKLLKPIKDRRTSGDWDRWLDIGYWVTTQGYSAASKKTAVKNWSGRTNQISVTQIKKKLPLVHAFATEIVADLPKYMEFTKKILGICVSDYELGKLFFASYHLITLDPLYDAHTTHSKLYDYYYIHHTLSKGKGRRTCGPFKKHEIPGLRLIGSKPDVLEATQEGFSIVRDVLVEIANMYSKYPAADLEDSRKYRNVAKGTFL